MIAGIVLAGGASRRMGGVDKLALEVGGSTLLERVLEAAGSVCDEVVVVGPARPTSVPGVRFTIEARPGGGPVPAVQAGLEHLGAVDVVLVLAADMPLLTPTALCRLLAALADDVEGAAALDPHGGPNPLLAAYAAPALQAHAAKLGPGAPASELLPPSTAVVDLGPDVTLNVNGPEDLRRARSLAGALGVRAAGRGTPRDGR